MLRRSLAVLAFAPRDLGDAPPPLLRRGGHFECKRCEHAWTSQHVWVVAQTQKPYQQQSCTRCGVPNVPRSVFWLGDATPPDGERWMMRRRAQYNRQRVRR